MVRSSRLTIIILFFTFVTAVFMLWLPPIHAQEETVPQPVLSISPREIDLGSLNPGQTQKGKFIFRNLGDGIIAWATQPVSGWTFVDQERLSGSVNRDPASLMVHVSFAAGDHEADAARTKPVRRTVILSLEGGGKQITGRKDLAAGVHREAIRLTSSGGSRTIFIRFNIVQQNAAPSLSVEPPRLDFGFVGAGEEVTRRIRLSNTGRNSLQWQVSTAKAEKDAIPKNRGHYISFHNEDIRDGGTYQPSSRLREFSEFSGGWSEEEGYPLSHPVTSSLKYRFTGTGFAVYLWRSAGGGSMSFYIDNKFIRTIDCFSEQNERFLFDGVEGLPNESHELIIIVKNGAVKIEGLTLYGQEVTPGPKGWMTVFPDSGVTTREIDFVNIMIHTQNLPQGHYRDDILINSTGGDQIVDVSVEVSADNTPKIIDVYRYFRDQDCLFTVNPQAESKRLLDWGYQKQGIAFRLFSTGTPGTTAFYRWFNPQKRDHFYSVNRSGTKSLAGYVLEGPIGNIATSRLNNTRPLYRWYHSKSGHHFFTTDQSGEGRSRKGFKFEGIVGYVH